MLTSRLFKRLLSKWDGRSLTRFRFVRLLYILGGPSVVSGAVSSGRWQYIKSSPKTRSGPRWEQWMECLQWTTGITHLSLVEPASKARTSLPTIRFLYLSQRYYGRQIFIDCRYIIHSCSALPNIAFSPLLRKWVCPYSPDREVVFVLRHDPDRF